MSEPFQRRFNGVDGMVGYTGGERFEPGQLLPPGTTEIFVTYEFETTEEEQAMGAPEDGLFFGTFDVPVSRREMLERFDELRDELNSEEDWGSGPQWVT